MYINLFIINLLVLQCLTTDEQGILLVAQLSCKDNLITPEYTTKAIEFADQHKHSVVGLISQRKLTNNPQILTLTPGVSLSSAGDSLGQKYISPQHAINNGSDIVIVGRGITESSNRLETCRQYRKAAFDAYQATIASHSSE